LRNFLIRFIATGAGFGLSPIVPGTTGTIPGVVLCWFLFPLFALFPYGIIFQIVITLVTLALGVWAATEAEKFYGHDAKRIVIDEVAGAMVSYLAIPVGWKLYLIGFVVFRALDIWKPYPARKWENLPRGWGVMGDDFAVAIYTNIFLQMLILFRIVT
jgi:phosphatidylglycerophosphatase A